MEDLQEGDDHDDGEDEDADGFETAAADWEFVREAGEVPCYEGVGGVDYEGAEEVEGGVDKGGEEREGAGEDGCCYFGD